MPSRLPAILALADGTIFRGVSIGATGETVGEVVFNTAMTGYQEILTDPSYCRQIVTLTYPHIGNTGVNDEDVESHRVFAAGLVIRDLPDSRQQLPDDDDPRASTCSSKGSSRSRTSTRAGSRASCARRAPRAAASRRAKRTRRGHLRSPASFPVSRGWTSRRS